MSGSHSHSLICRRYADVFGASLRPAFAEWHHGAAAALGYRRAGAEPLFLEAYLDRPVEQVVGEALGRAVPRGAIVEIGNFAADNAFRMIELWGAAANDLGSDSEFAVATLTAPLRRMFARIGVPITVLAPARAEAVGGAGEWGSYYATDPQVCMGRIADGQRAIAAFLARRARSQAA